MPGAAQQIFYPQGIELRDIPFLIEVQNRAYRPDLQEIAEVFVAQVTSSPDTCFKLSDRNALRGYLITLPIAYPELPRLHDPSYVKPDAPNALYIHDLAVDPGAAGGGVGKQLLARAFQKAEQLGLNSIYLIAVQDSGPYWSKFGFTNVQDAPETVVKKVATFGPDAVLMVAATSTTISKCR